MISITHAAKKILIQSWKQSGSKYIEFGVKSGGCSGFKYYLKPTNDKSKLDEIVNLDEDALLKIDSMSQLHLIGTEIDWVNDIMGNRFVFNNPNAEFKCGCGSSFG